MKPSLMPSILALSLLSAVAVAHEHPVAPAAPAQWEAIKSLVGDWKGSGVMDGQKVDAKTSFRLTSGGSAIVETMAGGTPHEMTNVYHLVDGKVTMTHYCAMGNAPQMKMTKADAKSMSFEAVRANGIDPAKTPHMHALTYQFADKDHFSASWTAANMGKEKQEPGVFNYERVP